MTEKEKRFKILEKKSYEEQISEENKKAVIKTFLAGFSAAAAIFILPMATEVSIEPQLLTRIFDVTAGVFSATFSVYHIKGLIESIIKKTSLQGKVDDIDSQLEMYNKEESRGMGR